MSLADAIELLASEAGAVALAGGQSLLPLVALRRARPALLVDLADLDGLLGGIRLVAGGLEIGALARQQDLLADPLVREHAPLLAAAARLVANPQVRARGTVGGALAHADPPAELPVALAALRASAAVTGPAGERAIALTGDGRALELAPGELVTRVVVPRSPRSAGWDFDEVAARWAARPLVSVAALAGDDPRLCVGGLTAGPVVLELEGSEPTAKWVCARLEELPAVPDARASLPYRLHLAGALGERSLRRATRGERPLPVPAGPMPSSPPAGRVQSPSETPAVDVLVNDRRHELSVAAGTTLAQLLRDELGLTATHLGCEHGVCGSCNVLLDGTAVRSCLTLAAQADGRTVTTVEGLRDAGRLDRLLPAFVANQALQCGFCTPGVLVTLAGLSERPADRRELREQLVGNLCRCTGYRPILDIAEAAL